MFYVENTNIHFKIKCKDSLSYVFWNTLCVNMFSSSLTTSIKFNTGMLLMSARTNSIWTVGRVKGYLRKVGGGLTRNKFLQQNWKSSPHIEYKPKRKKNMGKAVGSWACSERKVNTIHKKTEQHTVSRGGVLSWELSTYCHEGPDKKVWPTPFSCWNTDDDPPGGRSESHPYKATEDTWSRKERNYSRLEEMVKDHKVQHRFIF